MAARKRRRNRRRRIGIRTILVTVLVVLLAGAGVWLVGFSSVLAVRDISVSGAKLLSEDQVRDTAQVPLGVPLARLDTDRIGSRLADLPPVRSVDVSRSWPHTLHIEIIERTPRFVAHNKGTWMLVDDTGFGYSEVNEAPEDLVVAKEVPDGEWSDTAQVVRALPSTVAERAQSVTTRGPNAIVIHLDRGVRIEWGGADRSADKALVLSSLMTAAPNAKVYNVSAPDHPTTR
ncbi:cell division protein FtsQ/DivIB [Enemella sp. A6]|uniref:cell division protein FtsQ/DivIB n=1 Tax=Enemella sp. A6 TaxID=3440152 RepID=UPI003EB74485